MNKRADVHRPGAIRPQDYRPVLTYSLATMQDGWPVPSCGVNCELDRRNRETGESGKHDPDGRCCVVGLLHIAKVAFVATGGTGKCSICGANFVYGDVWVHAPTGEHVHLGHTCVNKYELLADRDDWQAELDAAARRRAARFEELRRDAVLASYVAENPYMGDVLSHDHPILRDMRQKVRQWGALTPKQADFACLLFSEAMSPERPKVEEKLVPAPTGRVTVRGKVVSVKLQEGAYGETWRMTVKVSTEDGGTWLAWGTCPETLCEAGRTAVPGNMPEGLRGKEVEFTATLQAGREPHFAMAKRPTRARVLAA